MSSIGEGRRISVLGAIILVALTVAAGVAVYVIMQREAENILGRSLQTALQVRVRLFENQFEQSLGSTRLIATRPFLIDNIVSLRSDPGDAKALAALQKAGASFLATGFSFVQFLDGSGRSVASAGTTASTPALRIPLRNEKNAELLWQGGVILRSAMDIVDRNRQRIGTVITEAPLPGLEHLVTDTRSIGESGELAVCAPLDRDMQCFPTTLARKVFPRVPRRVEGQSLPMDFALNGESGIVQSRDYRKKDVVASYAPIGKTGLGMVLKVDRDELIKPVTRQLRNIGPLLLALVVAGILLLRWLVTPLVRQLVSSERATRKANAMLKDSETRVRAVLESVGEAIITVDQDGHIETLNRAAERIFGYQEAELLGQHTDRIFAEPIFGALVAESSRNGSSEQGEGFGAHHQLTGIRAGGERFPLELNASEMCMESRRVFILSASDITQRKVAEDRILYLATHDALTGLPNRNLLQDRIERALAQSRRNHTRGAVLFIDLDHFKNINDSLGHAVGDMLLRTVAERLKTRLREDDTVARQGGDEFIVVLPRLSEPDHAKVVADKLLDSLKAPYSIAGNELHTSASIGIALFPEDGREADVLLQNSDTAMYHAKESGRNNCQFFAPRMNQLAAEKYMLRTLLYSAVERDELLLHYQPMVDIASGQMIGMEALLRWQHPAQGLIAPIKFVPLAEETGLIIPIGEWVIRAACRQIKSWQAEGYAVPRVAINLSARQFRHPNLAQLISDILAETGVSPQNLEVEITETMLMQNAEDGAKVLRELNAMGIDIAVDDFGTGYSSLNYLKRFPIDKLKIDKSFVQDIVADADDAVIVTAIITLAHSLQIKVIAEGVEEEAQLEFLTDQGCDQFQGYYYSKPLLADRLAERLQRVSDTRTVLN